MIKESYLRVNFGNLLSEEVVSLLKDRKKRIDYEMFIIVHLRVDVIVGFANRSKGRH